MTDKVTPSPVSFLYYHLFSCLNSFSYLQGKRARTDQDDVESLDEFVDESINDAKGVPSAKGPALTSSNKVCSS